MTVPQQIDQSSFQSISSTLKIKIGERSWRTVSWSVAGAVVKGELGGLIDGAVYPAALRFGDNTILEIPAGVKLYSGADMSRLDFVDMSGAHAELIHRYVTNTLESSESDLLYLLQAANDDLPTHKPGTSGALARRVRIAVTLLFTLALLAAAGWMLYLSLTTVTSVAAAVSVQGRTIHAPLSGTLTGPLPAPGSRVVRGDVIAHISSPEIERRTATLDIEETPLIDEFETVALRSPCDCQVLTVSARRDEMVPAQARLAVLADPDSLFVQALIPADKVAGLREGDDVLVELANREQVHGSISAISYLRGAETIIGLPVDAQQGHHARLEIDVPDLDPALVGMSAQVRVTSRQMQDLIGWDIVRSLLP